MNFQEEDALTTLSLNNLLQYVQKSFYQAIPKQRKVSSNVAKQDYCNAIPKTFDHVRGQECKVVVVFLLSKQGSVYSKSVEIF